MSRVRVIGMYVKPPAEGIVVNTTSKADNWERDLSPFHLGPCDLYEGRKALLMENAWQFSKLYACHATDAGEPLSAHWDWAEAGWANPVPKRYPMGKGARPLCSLWMGKRLGYIEARKTIYAPLYIESVRKTKGWRKLKELYESGETLILRDYDGYDHIALGATLTEVLNEPRRKMGHAFVLAMMLTEDPALGELASEGLT